MRLQGAQSKNTDFWNSSYVHANVWQWNWAVPFRLDAIFQDSNVALSLVQWQDIYETAISFDYPCMDGCFTNTGVLWRESVEVENNI